jgi:hypothetical protein
VVDGWRMATEIMVMTDDAQVEWREGSHVEDVLAGREGNEFGAFFWREDEWNIKFNAATWKMFWREECLPDRRRNPPATKFLARRSRRCRRRYTPT